MQKYVAPGDHWLDSCQLRKEKVPWVENVEHKIPLIYNF